VAGLPRLLICFPPTRKSRTDRTFSVSSLSGYRPLVLRRTQDIIRHNHTPGAGWVRLLLYALVFTIAAEAPNASR
jgi:hypothetical protein